MCEKGRRVKEREKNTRTGIKKAAIKFRCENIRHSGELVKQ